MLGMRSVVSVQSVPIRFFIRISKSLSQPERLLSFRARGEHYELPTALEIRIERIERMKNGLLSCSAMGLCAWRAVLIWLATEVTAGTPLSSPAVANKKTAASFGAITPGLYWFNRG